MFDFAGYAGRIRENISAVWLCDAVFVGVSHGRVLVVDQQLHGAEDGFFQDVPYISSSIFATDSKHRNLAGQTLSHP